MLIIITYQATLQFKIYISYIHVRTHTQPNTWEMTKTRGRYIKIGYINLSLSLSYDDSFENIL